jgi:hypothetical protein
MLFTILGAITGLAGPISQAVANLTNLQIAKVTASTNESKMQIDAQISEAHDRVMVLTAEAGSRINAIIRGMMAFGPMTYLNKVFIWDKVIGSFLGHAKGGDMWSTDPLDANLWTVVTVVLSFYFVYDIAASWRKK